MAVKFFKILHFMTWWISKMTPTLEQLTCAIRRFLDTFPKAIQ